MPSGGIILSVTAFQVSHTTSGSCCRLSFSVTLGGTGPYSRVCAAESIAPLSWSSLTQNWASEVELLSRIVSFGLNAWWVDCCPTLVPPAALPSDRHPSWSRPSTGSAPSTVIKNNTQRL